MALKMKLISDWRKAHKFASIQWSVLGFISMFIEMMHSTWFSLPPYILAKIPNASTVGMVLFGIVIVGRLVKFVRTDDNGDDNS